MAGRAVALQRILEQLKTALFRRAQIGVACQIGVIFAVIRMEARVLGLEARQRKHRLVQCKRRLLEDVRSEQLLQVVGIGRALETLHQLLDVMIVHLVRIEQGTERLGLEGVGAAVAVEAALRDIRFRGGACRGVGRGLGDGCDLDAACRHRGRGGRAGVERDRVVVGHFRIGADRKIRRMFEIAQRWDRTETPVFHVGAPELDGEVVRRGVGRVGIVACGA